MTAADVRRHRIESAALAALTIVLTVVLLALPVPASDKTSVVVPLFFLAMGVLISLRQPGNTEGRLLELIAVAWAVTFLVPFAGAWVVPLGLMGTHLLLRFPNGRLPSSKWRPVSWLSTVAIVVLPVIVTTSSRESLTPGEANPYYVSWLSPFAWLLVLLPIAMLLSVASLFVRYRRVDDVQRHQIRWLAYAAAVVVVWYVVVLTVSLLYDATHSIDSTQSSWFGTGYPWWVLALEASALLSFVLIPAGFAIGILKYRLYDIDRIISRTVSYAVVTGLLVLTFSVIVLAASRLFSGSPNLVVAGATLAAAALARPLLHRVQTGVDRRFNRSRYDAVQTVEEFGRRLRGELDVAEVEALLLATAAHVLQPRTARVVVLR